MNPRHVSFIHTGDTHLGPDPDFTLYGKNTLAGARELLTLIRDCGSRPDFVIHTGDIVNSPDPAAFRLAAAHFSGFDTPVYFVNGNHDDGDSIMGLMDPRTFERMDTPGASYAFEMNGYRFLALDAKGRPEDDPHGLFDLGRERVLRAFLESGRESPVALFVHFPPVPLDVPWVDRDMLMAGGDRFHAIVREHRERVAGVFFGHIHQSLSMLKDGVFYCSAPSPFCRFSALPGDKDVRYQPDVPVSFNFVTLIGKQAIAREHLGHPPSPRPG